MYEVALRDWHVTPEYINRHWTEEILALMFRSRLKTLRDLKHMQSESPNTPIPGNVHRPMRCDTFMAKHGFTVEKR